MKHTSGPWVAVGGLVEVENDNIPDICTCNPHDFGQAHLKRNVLEVLSNARLIAAAPDLLAALKVAEKAMQADISGIDIGASFEQIRAAIAKATGEQYETRHL